MGKNTAKATPQQLVDNQWKSGQSGNPAGRPKGAKDGVAACLRRVLAKKANSLTPDDIKRAKLVTTKATVADVVAAVATHKAIKGSARHLQIVLDFTEPKPKQTHELTGPDGGPIQLQNTGARKRIASRFARLGEDPGTDPPGDGGDE